MYSLQKRLQSFSAAHRLNKGYRGKCKDLHGHNYKVDIRLCSHSLDDYDFVMDFGDITLHFEAWLQQHWDHVTLVSDLDTELLTFLQQTQQAHYVLPNAQNTTAENLAKFLYDTFCAILATLPAALNQRVWISEICLHESDTSQAIYQAPPSVDSSHA